MTTNLSALIAKLEGSAEGSHGLDDAIARAISGTEDHAWYVWRAANSTEQLAPRMYWEGREAPALARVAA